MKKMNLIAASVAMLFTGVASAGNLTSAAAAPFATEVFASSATAVTPAAVTYSVATTNGIVVNQNGVLYYTVTLGGGAKFATAVVAGDLTGSVKDLLNATVTIADGGAVGDSQVVFAITAGASPTTIGVGSTLKYLPTALSIKGLAALATAGSVNITTGLSALGSSATLTAGVTPADIDGGAPVSTAFATSETALTAKVTNGGETAKIDVAGTPVGSVFAGSLAAGTHAAIVGKVAYSVNDDAPVEADGTTAYDVTAALDTGASVKVTVSSTAGFPIGSKVFLAKTTACAPLSTAVSVTVDSTNTATGIVLSAAGGSLTDILALSGAFACLDNSTQVSGANPTLVPSQFSLVTALAPASALTGYASTAGSGNGLNLTYNGAVATVSNYWPAALTDAYGYQGFVRIVNTGSLAAAFTGQFVNADGSKSGSAAITTSIPAGGAMTITSQAIEAAIGAAQDVTARPRLTVSGNTSSVDVQTFIQSPNGTFVKTN